MLNDMILVFNIITTCYKSLNTLIDFQKPCYGNLRAFIQYLTIY